MQKIYYLANCSTCKKMMNSLNLEGFELREIKNDPITIKELQEMKERSGSFEALFSKRANLYKELELKNKSLTEKDYKDYILAHYAFLKRPVVLMDQEIYIGSSPKTKQLLQKKIGKV